MIFEQNKGRVGNLIYSQIREFLGPQLLLLALILLPAVFLGGCSGLVSGQSRTTPPPPSSTFSISGTITPAAGGNGATVTLRGAANATATADSSGNYTFTGLSNGTYALTPSHAGYTFNPASQNATISGANVAGVNFTATVQTGQTFGISGTISPTVGGNGATVTLSGTVSATTTANSSGNYTFTGLSNGTYAVTPSHAGYTFNPTSQNATISGANVPGLNFTATAQTGQTFSISGTISPVLGGSGATVTLSGAGSATTTTNSAGTYSIAGLSSGSYTVTPSQTGFAFNPVSQSVPVNGSNVGNVNFTATAQPVHTVALTWNASTSAVTGYNVYRTTVSGTGYAKVNSLLVAVLAYTDAAVQNGITYYYVTTAVDSNGNESAFSNESPAVVP
jgi:hypothetical protein